MRCLRFLPESHPFLLGFDSVQIKGGLRPLDDNLAITGTKRSWAEIEPARVPLLSDPRNIFPSNTQPDENAPRGSGKRGRGARGARRGNRGRFRRN